MTETVLVTGATGFVGSAIVRALLARHRRVRVLARAGSDRSNLAGLDIEVATGDLTDPASLVRAVEGCGALFHVAADYRLWVPDPVLMRRTNIDGTRDLLRAATAAGMKRIVYTSSVATLALDGSGRPAAEDSVARLDDMVGPYKQSKFLAEEEVRRLVREEGVPAVIVNPSTPVGPGDVRPTPTGRMIVEAACGRMPAFVDTGLNIVHVADVAEGHLLAYDKGAVGERYILGGDDMTLAEILARIAAIVGRKPPTVKLPRRLLMPVAAAAEGWARLTGREPFVTMDGLRMAAKHMYFTSAKAERELGYRARPAGEALTDAVAYFRKRGLVA
jgi:dihydroflavonol-4-reductase